MERGSSIFQNSNSICLKYIRWIFGLIRKITRCFFRSMKRKLLRNCMRVRSYFIIITFFKLNLYIHLLLDCRRFWYSGYDALDVAAEESNDQRRSPQMISAICNGILFKMARLRNTTFSCFSDKIAGNGVNYLGNNKQIEFYRRKCVSLIKIPENSPNGIRAPEGPKQGVLGGVVT